MEGRPLLPSREGDRDGRRRVMELRGVKSSALTGFGLADAARAGVVDEAKVCFVAAVAGRVAAGGGIGIKSFFGVGSDGPRLVVDEGALLSFLRSEGGVSPNARRYSATVCFKRIRVT